MKNKNLAWQPIRPQLIAAAYTVIDKMAIIAENMKDIIPRREKKLYGKKNQLRKVSNNKTS